MIALLLWLVGCGAPADCDRVRGEVAREDCRFERATVLYETDPRAFRSALDGIPTPESRDLVRLRLAIRDPAGAQVLCREVETPPAQEKCRQVLGRPHLTTAPRSAGARPPADAPAGPPEGRR